MRTLLTLTAVALLAGTMGAYAIDQQTSDEAWGYTGIGVGSPAYPLGARAQVPTAVMPAPAITAPAFSAPIDTQQPDLSR